MPSRSFKCKSCGNRFFMMLPRNPTFSFIYMTLIERGWHYLDEGRTLYCSLECRSDQAKDITPKKEETKCI